MRGAGTVEQFEIAVAHEVLIAHRRPGLLRQSLHRINAEFHVSKVVVTEFDGAHRSDRHPGDPYLVAGFQPGHIDELGCVTVLVASSHLPEDQHEPSIDQQHHRHEDAEFDAVAAPLHRIAVPNR